MSWDKLGQVFPGTREGSRVAIPCRMSWDILENPRTLWDLLVWHQGGQMPCLPGCPGMSLGILGTFGLVRPGTREGNCNAMYNVPGCPEVLGQPGTL